MENKNKRRSLRSLKKNGAKAEKNVEGPSNSTSSPAALKLASKAVCTKVVFSPHGDIFTAINAQKSRALESDSVLVVVEMEDSQDHCEAGGDFERSDYPDTTTDKMGKSVQSNVVSANNDPSSESSTVNENTDPLQVPEPSEECEILSDSLPVVLPTAPELNSTITTEAEAKNTGDILLIAGLEPNVVEVWTHKSLLMKASSYFMELFARSPDTSSFGSNMVEKRKIEISDPQILKLLVKKLEEDSLVSFQDAMKLIKDSTKLQTDLLTSKCMTAIVGNVTAKNVLRLKLLAVESDNKDLCRVADAHFEKYINTVISSKEFLSLSLKQIAGLILPSNRAISARCVDKMAEAWLAHENRRMNDSYFCQITSLQILRMDSKLEESIFWNENGTGGEMSSRLPLFEPPDIPGWVYMQAVVTPKRAANALPDLSQIYVAPSSMKSPCQSTLKFEVDENDPTPMDALSGFSISNEVKVKRELVFADGIFDITSTADFKSPPRHKISSLPKIPKITDRLKSISNSEFLDTASDPWALKGNSKSWNPMNSQSSKGEPKPSGYGSSDLSSWARGGVRSGSNFGGSRGRGGERSGRGNNGSRGGYGFDGGSSEGRGGSSFRGGRGQWGGSQQGASGDDEDWGAPSTTAQAPSAAPQCRNSSNNSNAGDEDDWGAPVKKPSVATPEDSWGQSTGSSNFNARDSWDNKNNGSGSRGFGNGNSSNGRGRGGRGFNNNSSRTSSCGDDWGSSTAPRANNPEPTDDFDYWGDTKASSSSIGEAKDNNKRKCDSWDDWGSAPSSNFNQGDSQAKYTRGSDGFRGNSNRGRGNSNFRGNGRGGGGRGGFGNNSSWGSNSGKNDDDDWGSTPSSKNNTSVQDDDWGTTATSGDSKKKTDDGDDWGSSPSTTSANSKPKASWDDDWGSTSNSNNGVSGRGGGGRGGWGNNRNESSGRNSDYQGGRGRGGGGYRGGGDSFRSRGGGRGGGDRFGGGGRGGRGGYNSDSSRGGYNNNKSNWGGGNQSAVENLAPEDEDWDSEPKAKTAEASTNVNSQVQSPKIAPKIDDDDEWGDPVVTQSQTPVAVAVVASHPQEPKASVKPTGADPDDEWGDGVTVQHSGSAHVPVPANAVKCMPVLVVSVPVTAAQMETPQADAKTTFIEPSPAAVSQSENKKNDEDKFVSETQENGNGNGNGTSADSGTLIQNLMPPAALPPTVEVKPSVPLPSNDEEDEWG